MRATNTTQGTTLCERGELARTFWPRLRGLMFRASLDEGQALLLEPESSIHTFGMRFPIDVLYLDEGWRVMRLEEAMAPNRVGPIVRGCRAVLELPTGVIRKTATAVGDQLQIEE